MKLVESEVREQPTKETAPPPRPPRRRVAVSLIFTLSVLIGTVTVIYVVFPKRNNEALTIAMEHHRNPKAWELEGPNRGELIAWSIGLHEKPVPWPLIPDQVKIVGSYGMRIFKRPVALVRLEVEGQPVTLLAMRARDAVPRPRKSEDGDLIAQSWRAKKWTFVAVGAKASADTWRPVVGAN